ncbi:hypothetical protein [Streptomyces sp. NPDC102282]|uniref:hypothetical protein n=1 Tax=Streptomyces sp. NPDC102282 TaxID=3366154 RepID=UPI003803444B
MRDEAAYRRAVLQLVDTVLTDDSVYLDSLSDRVQVELTTPLCMAAQALEEGRSAVELAEAVDLVHAAAAVVRSELPDELWVLIESIRFLGRR